MAWTEITDRQERAREDGRCISDKICEVRDMLDEICADVAAMEEEYSEPEERTVTHTRTRRRRYY